MRDWRLLLVGFGTVGRGFAERLDDAADELRALGVRPRLVGVVDPFVGSVAALPGSALDPGELVARVEAGRSLTGMSEVRPLEDLSAALADVEADVMAECTPTDLRDGGAGLLHVRAALEAGLHVITTNKGPVALAWSELAGRARERGVQLRCEGTVLSGTPVFGLWEAGLRGAGLDAVRGVLNGTCNFILGRIETGSDWEAALAEAQALGYAETDPSGDVDGHDAAAKVTILANLLFDAGVTLAVVECAGIRELDPALVRAAPARGRRWKHVAEIVPDGTGGLALGVGPKELAADDPLARVEGAGNVLVFETRALGPVAISGPGAGRAATGHALITDLLAIHRAVGA